MTEERRRAIRTCVSAVLLAAGTLAFLGSLALPAVTKVGTFGPGDTRRTGLEGWTCAWNHGPTAATNWFLATAFAVWSAAHWWRSIWAWYLGVAAGGVAVLVHGFVGAWPGYEGIVRLHSGYWTWLAASAVTCAAFLLLPKPERPPPGERLPVEDRDRGRAGIAAILGSAATAAVAAVYLFIPTSSDADLVVGVPPGDAVPAWYTVGPTESGHVTTTLRVTGPDGTFEDVEHWYRARWTTVLQCAFGDAARGALAISSLLLPAVFLAAATTRRRPWRFGGAALAAAVTLVVSVWIDHPWPTSGTSPHPLHLLWIATPAAFVPAFLLLPPRRTGAARTTESSHSAELATPPHQGTPATE